MGSFYSKSRPGLLSVYAGWTGRKAGVRLFSGRLIRSKTIRQRIQVHHSVSVVGQTLCEDVGQASHKGKLIALALLVLRRNKSFYWIITSCKLSIFIMYDAFVGVRLRAFSIWKIRYELIGKSLECRF